jgi:hypothetical protein
VGGTGEGVFRNSVVMWPRPPEMSSRDAVQGGEVSWRSVEREGVLLLHLFHTTCVVSGTLASTFQESPSSFSSNTCRRHLFAAEASPFEAD